MAEAGVDAAATAEIPAAAGGGRVGRVRKPSKRVLDSEESEKEIEQQKDLFTARAAEKPAR